LRRTCLNWYLVEREEDRGDVRRTERRYGQFYRAIALPDGADAQNARAEFRNGVLQVVIPVAEAQRNVRAYRDGNLVVSAIWRSP
jgi:HSP20 family molecular chaperone IbpA